LSAVTLIKCSDYSPEAVDGAVGRAVDSLGGISSFVKPGMTVLLKPNMLAARSIDKAVTTHPEVVRAVIRLVKQAGGIPAVGDSQAIGGFAKIAETTGIAAVCAEEGAELVELSEAVRVAGKGTFKHFELAKRVVEADAVINLPKAKTHCQMLLTLAVKNLFGCIPGTRKAQWHFKAGVDKTAFATMLVEIHELVRPVLNIVDGVIGMEGNGPGSGTPRELGFIAASPDAHSLDIVLAEVLGVSHEMVPTIRLAKSRGLAPAGLGEIEVVGDYAGIEEARVRDFKLASASNLEWSIPEPVRKVLKSALTAKPVVDKDKCVNCMMCKEACPIAAIGPGKGRPDINLRLCIRCFCCQEICPKGAIEAAEGWLLKYLS
jgi:uncharacterized protein (DUF362 family)/Pyruvate/2-oxoacid:ferredoxin oxidoreductase delta subunit